MNKHVDNAYAMLNMPGSDSLEGVSLALHAVTESNLAVAYEQHTANLIAFERSQWEAWRRDELTVEGVELWERTSKQLKGRLGL